ncbi:MAG: DUF2933 domain-containing protein [Planctomycetota bacterium]
MSNIEEPKNRAASGNLMKYGMWACCAVMLLPVAAYLAAGGLSAGAMNSIATFAPLLLCVGAHFVMHRFMGKSCHGASKDKGAATPKAHVRISPKTVPE